MAKKKKKKSTKKKPDIRLSIKGISFEEGIKVLLTPLPAKNKKS